MLIPNTFQYPNYYNDVIDQYLTPEESKVLTRAIREILGWEQTRQTRTAHISLSTFEHGNKRIGSAGIGLSRKTIIHALEALHKFKILLKSGNVDSQGQAYKLNLDEKTIDFDSLKRRLAEKAAENKQRTAEARRASKTKHARPAHAGVSDSTTTGVSDNTSAGVSDSTATGVSDNMSAGVSDTHTERNPKKNEKKEMIQQQQQQQISPPKNDVVDVDARINSINSILKNARREERITLPLFRQIMQIHALESPAELIQATKALASQTHIRSVIAVLKGKKTPDGYESGCFADGRCYLYTPEDTPPPQPTDLIRGNEEAVAMRIMSSARELDDAAKARIRAQIEQKFVRFKTQWQPEVYADTLETAYRLALSNGDVILGGFRAQP